MTATIRMIPNFATNKATPIARRSCSTKPVLFEGLAETLNLFLRPIIRMYTAENVDAL